MKSRFNMLFRTVVFCLISNSSLFAQSGEAYQFQSNGNPIITHKYTADPAALVVNDTLWLFAGQDGGPDAKGYSLRNWCVFSTTDMKNWTEHPIPLRISDFSWDRSKNAYASHVVEKNGMYYWYISTNGSGIGVAVSDRPQGPFKDALGKPLLTRADCFASKHGWVCIDPAVYIEDNGQAWIFWGNRECYYAKLKDNMIEIDGEIKQIKFNGFENFTEAPWVHKYKGKYYLTYASGFPEKISYAMADNIEGPWEYKGLLNEVAGNTTTNHQAIVEYKGKWYFIYHNGALPGGGGASRSVCIDRLYYNKDKTLKRIIMTSEGVPTLKK